VPGHADGPTGLLAPVPKVALFFLSVADDADDVPRHPDGAAHAPGPLHLRPRTSPMPMHHAKHPCSTSRRPRAMKPWVERWTPSPPNTAKGPSAAAVSTTATSTASTAAWNTATSLRTNKQTRWWPNLCRSSARLSPRQPGFTPPGGATAGGHAPVRPMTDERPMTSASSASFCWFRPSATATERICASRLSAWAGSQHKSSTPDARRTMR